MRELSAVTVEEFLAVDPASLPAAALGELLTVVEQVRRRLDALQATALRAFDAAGAADLDGAASTAAWLRDRLTAADRDARRAVGLARSLDRLPVMTAALAAGEVTVAHARVLALQSKTLDPATVAAGEPVLVGWARRLDPHRFATVVRRWVATVAPAEFERDTQRRYDARWLTVSPTYAGMASIAGLLDPEAGTLLTTALDALMSATPPGDTRSRQQQRADALTDLVTIATTHAALPTTGGHRPEIIVHVPADTLTADPARGTSGGTRGGGGGTRGGGPATLADGTPLTRAALDRLTCDATYRRLVIDPAGIPLDLGRATRLIPPPLRRYLTLRDGGCRYPGCPRPAPHCEAHHVTYWHHGGPTAATNLVLLCRYHHHLVHDRDRDRDHHLTLHPDGTLDATRPDGRTLTSRPRGPTAATAA